MQCGYLLFICGILSSTILNEEISAFHASYVPWRAASMSTANGNSAEFFTDPLYPEISSLVIE